MYEVNAINIERQQMMLPLIVWSKKYYIIFVKSSELHIFYKQPNFPVELRVAIERAQNQGKGCYEVATNFRLL